MPDELIPLAVVFYLRCAMNQSREFKNPKKKQWGLVYKIFNCAMFNLQPERISFFDSLDAFLDDASNTELKYLVDRPAERKAASDIANYLRNFEPSFKGQRPFIPIGGTPGSGKTTFARNVVDILREEHMISGLVVGMDGYQFSESEQDDLEEEIGHK